MRPAAIIVSMAIVLAGCAHPMRPAETRPASPSPEYSIGPVLLADPLADMSGWRTELERGGTVEARSGTMTIDVPRGCSVWLKEELSGPILIQYDARLVKADPPGPNDRVSDLNCFWMATDARNPAEFFAVPRSGKFADYNQLRAYYVGQGGNSNKTTRFRRYIGDVESRPLLPEHDLSSPDVLLAPNQWQTLQIVACGPLIEYYRDGRRIFQYRDPAPYPRGYFAIRTTVNHMEVRSFRVYRLEPRDQKQESRSK